MRLPHILIVIGGANVVDRDETGREYEDIQKQPSNTRPERQPETYASLYGPYETITPHVYINEGDEP